MNHQHTIIIAEAGVNHNGSPELALRLADAAKEAGADYVKFQTFKTEALVDASAPKAEYQTRNSASGNTQYEMLKALELKFETFGMLSDHCRDIGIGFLSTPFDMESIDFLRSLDMDYMKIPSGEITNKPYLEKIGKCGLPVIMSTGMCSLGEIEQALAVLESAGTPRDRITLLHCNTEYPTPFGDVNLRAMDTLRRAFGTEVGYSDHTKGIEVAVAAVALGASVIEKHFTLDRNMEGPDHKASLDPASLRQMVGSIRNIELALGSAQKRPTDSEIRNITVARKSIVAARDIAEGEILDSTNMTVKRPGTGISPMKWDEITGRRASRAFRRDEQIEI